VAFCPSTSCSFVSKHCHLLIIIRTCSTPNTVEVTNIRHFALEQDFCYDTIIHVRTGRYNQEYNKNTDSINTFCTANTVVRRTSSVCLAFITKSAHSVAAQQQSVEPYKEPQGDLRLSKMIKQALK